MPIFEDDEQLDYAPSSNVEPIHQTQPNIIKPTISSPIVDSRYTPLSSLMIYIEGSPWTTYYFSQVLTTSTEPTAQAPSTGPIYQQYIKIKDLELRVTTALNYQQDTQTNDPVLTGEATMFPGIIPNEGDMFVADVGDGRLGVFTITAADSQSMLKDACYVITYIFTGYADDSRALLDDLEQKTVKTEVFVKELIGTHTRTFLSEEQVVTLDTLKRYYRDLIGLYFGLFYSYEYNCFLMPRADAESIYDPFVSKFISNILDINDHPLLAKIKHYNIDEPGAINSSSIYDVLLRNTAELLPLAAKQMWIVSPTLFSKWPYLKTIYHSRLDGVVYPKNHNPNVIGTENTVGNELYIVTVTIPATYTPIVPSIPPVSAPQGGLVLPPLIHSVKSHEFYGLSNAFYDDHPTGQSQLELLVKSYLQRDNIDWHYLKRLFEGSSAWDPVDKYYQLPILLVLLKQTIKKFI